MKEQFCTYEISKALKELGFDEECLAIYYKDDDSRKLLFSIAEKYSSNPEVAKHQARDCIRQINFNKGWAIKAPLWQQAIDFLRENYDLHIRIDLFKKGWTWNWTNLGEWNFSYPENQKYYKSYHKAREQAISKAMLCKQK